MNLMVTCDLFNNFQLKNPFESTFNITRIIYKLSRKVIFERKKNVKKNQEIIINQGKLHSII